MSNKLGRKKKLLQMAALEGLKVVAARPSIPEAIKREVRQRCGFGCVICGLPLYEYEHMKGWANVKEHVAKDITLLCDRHHREKTNGLLAAEMVFSADANPINKRTNSAPYNFYPQKGKIRIKVGNNFFWYGENELAAFGTPRMEILIIDGIPVLWFNFIDGSWLLNLTLYNNKNAAILEIRDNELVYSAEPWDISFIGTTLTVRSGRGAIILKLEVSPNEKSIYVHRASFRYNGYEIQATEKILGMPGTYSGLSSCHYEGTYRFISCGNGDPAPVHFAGARTYEVEQQSPSEIS